MFKLFALLALIAVAAAQVRHQWQPVDIGRPGSPDGRCNTPDGELVQTLPGDSCTNFRKCSQGISCEYKHAVHEFWINIILIYLQIRSIAQAVFTLMPSEDSATDPKTLTARLTVVGSLMKKPRNKPKCPMQSTLAPVQLWWNLKDIFLFKILLAYILLSIKNAIIELFCFHYGFRKFQTDDKFKFIWKKTKPRVFVKVYITLANTSLCT